MRATWCCGWPACATGWRWTPGTPSAAPSSAGRHARRWWPCPSSSARVVENLPAFLHEALARMAAMRPGWSPTCTSTSLCIDRPWRKPVGQRLVRSGSHHGGGQFMWMRPTKTCCLFPAPPSTDALPRPGRRCWAAPRAGGGQPRRRLLGARSWNDWRQAMIELAQAHPDLPGKATLISPVTAAMSSSSQGRMDKSAFGPENMDAAAPIKIEAIQHKPPTRPVPGSGCAAHSDWAGYSVFEGPLPQGTAAGTSPSLNVAFG